MTSSDSIPAAGSSPPPAAAFASPALVRPAFPLASSAFHSHADATNPAPHPSIAPPPVHTLNFFQKPPVSDAPPFDGMLIHPPFTVLPDNVVLDEPMSYMVLHHHPTWFLDIRDYVTLDGGAPAGTIRYPRELEPPRPRRQKDLILRCTFCPRTHLGVNAKALWIRHVREKHRVVFHKDKLSTTRHVSSACYRRGKLRN
ncbi:hypothetical protein MKEN_00265300 [Mycena kentingensis (nom. inval.)]|nr:hypothetical protein MKEN_00263300 [Mycena kentingensis (nom. inval.)]KAF7330013.1 hypothetical protein MKEN_00265300 [Mycena kentingensis (nom. inval.)]